MKALITGGAGFIGSHLAERLLAQGHTVSVLDDLSTGRLENIEHLVGDEHFTCTIGSVTNEAVVGRLIDQVDVVFHLAAAVGVRLVCERPVHTIETNVHGTETVLKQASAATQTCARRLDVRGLREGHRAAVPGGRRPCAGATHQDSVGLRHQQAARRVPGARLLEGAPVCPSSSCASSILSGRGRAVATAWCLPSFVKRALEGASDQRPWRRHADAQLHLGRRCGLGDADLVAEPKAVGEVFNIGNGAEISIRDLA